MKNSKKVMLLGLGIGFGLNALVTFLLLQAAQRPSSDHGAEAFMLLVTVPGIFIAGLVLFAIGAIMAGKGR